MTIFEKKTNHCRMVTLVRWRRWLLLTLGLLMLISLWMPWIVMNQASLIKGRHYLNGIEVIWFLNADQTNQLRLPMFLTMFNIFLATPAVGAGLSFGCLMNHKHWYRLFGLILPGALNVFWCIGFVVLLRNRLILELFDPLVTFGMGFLMLCPITLVSMFLSIVHIDALCSE